MQSGGKFRFDRPLVVRFGDSIGQSGSRDYSLRMLHVSKDLLESLYGIGT